MRLSILVPLYNEEEFIGPLLQRVLDAPLPDGMDREIIVVDDGSTDGSAEIAEELARCHPDCIRVLRHERNHGKGAAIRTALKAFEAGEGRDRAIVLITDGEQTESDALAKFRSNRFAGLLMFLACVAVGTATRRGFL